MKADKKNVECLADILSIYCANSGQKISEAKSSNYFSRNIEVEVKAEVCQVLNIMIESLTGKYLGLPALVGTYQTDCFCHLIDRVVNQISGWKEKTLSLGGKGTLIKSIAQVVPVYAMMVFRIPKTICKGLTSVLVGG
jgi:hypothetical protein